MTNAKPKETEGKNRKQGNLFFNKVNPGGYEMATKKQLTAIALCIVLVFASILCGCDTFAGFTKRRLAERKKEYDSYVVEVPGYHLKLAKEVKSGGSEIFDLLGNDMKFGESNRKITDDGVYEFSINNNRLEYVKIADDYSEVEKGYVDLYELMKSNYFKYFEDNFGQLICYKNMFFLVTKCHIPSGVRTEIRSVKPPALFVLHLEYKKIKYAGYCESFLTDSDYIYHSTQLKYIII